jgi:hypothetical protein
MSRSALKMNAPGAARKRALKKPHSEKTRLLDEEKLEYGSLNSNPPAIGIHLPKIYERYDHMLQLRSLFLVASAAIGLALGIFLV